MRAVHTIDELHQVIAGEICSVCGGFKRRGEAFCPTDMAALTIPQRLFLSRGVSDPNFQQSFISARRHLELNTTRRRQISFGGWAYTSGPQLADAGYKLRGEGYCSAPTCRQKIYWVESPEGRQVPVNREDWQPHRVSCTDPDYFRRRKAEKAAQTSAGTKRRRRSEK